MTFKVTIAQHPVSVEFEAGSIGEATAILSDNATALHQMFAVDVTGEGAVAAPEAPKTRGRPPRNKNQPDPATASAPPPLAVAPPPPTPPVPDTGGIPAFLDRNKPPPLPNAPPIAPPPPSGALASAVVAEVKKRTAGSPDNGKSMVTWLTQCGAVVDGATLDEAMACLPLIEPGKLGQIAGQLGVSA